MIIASPDGNITKAMSEIEIPGRQVVFADLEKYLTASQFTCMPEQFSKQAGPHS